VGDPAESGSTACEFTEGLPPSRAGEVRAHVPVVLGCSHACAYCIIPSKRGRERSRPTEEVLREARNLIEQGAREIILLGQIVDRYGLDLDPLTDLGALMRSVEHLKGVSRIRFLTSHPRYLSDSILDAMAGSSVICPHFELPIQSGTDEVLARMRRGYTVEEYRRLVGKIRERIPGAAIHTDLIVGFPGETEAQFEETLRLVEELRFDKIHLARYSPRPGTLAARRYPDDVPDAEKERRRRRIEDIQAGIQNEINRRFIGQIVSVLVEREETRRPGRWRGRTPDDRLVFLDGPGSLRGRVLDVRVTWAGPFTLVGERMDDVPAG
ncbi:MAG: MiaB/RimO family radical SAM methylthiotransferase, partial [Kiritimatiellia bacterium]|nr:MiaB/RimO family radical SAM methylthiotransferase [Kiritimatiellia bacterium]